MFSRLWDGRLRPKLSEVTAVTRIELTTMGFRGIFEDNKLPHVC